MPGYVFPGKMWEDKTPFDYVTDKATGKRPQMPIAPTGAIVHDLRPGIGGAVIPPIPIWKAGKFFPDLKREVQEVLSDRVAEKDRYDAYVVTGEYTPGNYIARIYILPRNIANSPEPDHPLDWTEWYQKGQSITSYNVTATGGRGNGFGFGGFGSPTPAEPAKAVTPPPPKKPAVPARVRIRCGGCGHWFKMDDLGAHAEYCCPGINGPDSDWAMQCECCDTLDEVQALKPGFPRPKKKEAEKKEVKKNGAIANTEDGAGKAEEAGTKPAAEPVASAD